MLPKGYLSYLKLPKFFKPSKRAYLGVAYVT
jgi:hypothetical protein